jgi:hypothetical protein
MGLFSDRNHQAAICLQKAIVLNTRSPEVDVLLVQMVAYEATDDHLIGGFVDRVRDDDGEDDGHRILSE